MTWCWAAAGAVGNSRARGWVGGLPAGWVLPIGVGAGRRSPWGSGTGARGSWQSLAAAHMLSWPVPRFLLVPEWAASPTCLAQGSVPGAPAHMGWPTPLPCAHLLLLVFTGHWSPLPETALAGTEEHCQATGGRGQGQARPSHAVCCSRLWRPQMRR